jgi:hypothetical protein
MVRAAAVVCLLAAMAATPVAQGRGGGHGDGHGGGHTSASHGHHGSPSSPHHSTHQGRAYPKRDAHGRIARDPHAKEAFRKTHPCPATGKTYGACPGYVVDHIRALKHGGADDPSNMQWQTRAAAKAKDRVE